MANDRRKPWKSLPLKLSHPGQRPTRGSDPMAKDSGYGEDGIYFDHRGVLWHRTFLFVN
jgi:hypothetical protein